MGKCNGLKGGGSHHRKALDVAAAKKVSKEKQRQEQIESSKRYTILKQILASTSTSSNNSIMSSAINSDIYLQVEDDYINDKPSLCRSYFRYDNCCNRRCKFSHQYSIFNALSLSLIHI